MRARTLALILSGMLAVYLLLLGRTGVLLLTSGSGVGIAFGLSVLVFPVIGAWIIYREIRFGFTTQKMTEVVVAAQGEGLEGEASDGEESELAEIGETDFEAVKSDAEANPRDWEPWFQVAVAYDEAGDRRQARKSMHHAASLFRAG
jgi:hypothetical protein